MLWGLNEVAYVKYWAQYFEHNGYLQMYAFFLVTFEYQLRNKIS